ncbi:DNA replication and repair protein RecF [Kaistia soli DSM 19436]|uniref:DNA replication and repair protein RecF n=1 Tax=Kaistia soli DSM 19436 TaxID=1122133 RepID=A0A1M5DVM8_9HYPH|nr:DNA replication/repair protein RecF [Kaistia soli]SHF70980.1 DNA replication and repair protein RecF [Kaistia soli DSM 19436]
MSVGEASAAPRVARIILSDFRSYTSLDLPVAGRLVALTGENGAGKTNLIEALSLFTAGRGLRRADLAEMARAGGDGGFAVSLALDGPSGDVRLGTGVERLPDGALSSRRCRIDGATVGSPAAFAEYIRVVWLTPALDAIFTGSAGDRRRFLDRLVLAIDARHGARVSAYERALRGRNRLLEDPRPDRAWLDGIEAEIASLGVDIARVRSDAVAKLAVLAAGERDDAAPFPFADLAIEGAVEAMLGDGDEAATERFRAALREARPRDAAAGRALIGPHTSDLKVRHGPKDVAAERASTGEQKALLVGIVLAHARLVAAASGLAPLVLLDEVAAHLDRRRRAALYDALSALGSQVFMTGADPQLFGELPSSAEIFMVRAGKIELYAREEHRS